MHRYRLVVALAALDVALAVAVIAAQRRERRLSARLSDRDRRAALVTTTAAELLVSSAYRRLQSETRHPSNEYPLTDG